MAVDEAVCETLPEVEEGCGQLSEEDGQEGAANSQNDGYAERDKVVLVGGALV